MLHPGPDAIHERETGESNGVGKEDSGCSYLPVLLKCEVRSAPGLLGSPEGDRVLAVV